MAARFHRSTEPRARGEEQPRVLRTGEVLDLREIGMELHVTRDRAQSDGRSFEMEMVLQPRAGGTPIHVHPDASESYEVLEGEFEVYVGDRWNRMAPGDMITVEKGVPHTFRNPSDGVTRLHNTHQPALRYDEFFLGLSHVANSGLVRSGRMSFKALLALAVLWTSLGAEIRSVRPPHHVMPALGSLGRLLGY